MTKKITNNKGAELSESILPFSRRYCCGNGNICDTNAEALMAITKRVKMSSKSNDSEIWKYFRGEYRCYTENIGLARRILSWKSVERGAIYYYPDFSIKGLDFIIRTRSYNRVARVIGLPKRKKLPRRIKKNQRLQESDRIGQVISSNVPAVEV